MKLETVQDGTSVAPVVLRVQKTNWVPVYVILVLELDNIRKLGTCPADSSHV